MCCTIKNRIMFLSYRHRENFSLEDKMNKIINRFVVCILITLRGCFAIDKSPVNGILFINEFMAANDSTIIDENGDYDDWIELYNAGDTDIDLGGMYLTDNFTNVTKWQIPDTCICAGGFLLIWADNETMEGPLHTNFKLSAANGEGIGLYDTETQENMLIDAKSFNPQARDTSYGRFPDGHNRWYVMPTPTPGTANVTE
jgi:hypothetical protein